MSPPVTCHHILEGVRSKFDPVSINAKQKAGSPSQHSQKHQAHIPQTAGLESPYSPLTKTATPSRQPGRPLARFAGIATVRHRTIRSVPCGERRGAAGRPFPRRRATADPCFSTDAGQSVRWRSQSAPGTRPARVQAGGVLLRTPVTPGCISTGEPAAGWSD